MADEITFQNDPVDPSVEFRKQQNHFFVADRAERLEPDRAAARLGRRARMGSGRHLTAKL